ncbi:hypothetical protein L53_05720 [Hyphomonas sp. L-53-1-40]|jgi:hypothetical protein|uniref:Cobalt-precorrin-8x methylmutase n=1 Tax=hydrothermal vent metagenome TaxID=652676 RepID=A0A160U249_9ZZZZ|nr:MULTISPECIES: hypothetical protein [unclassified Hyphomonas]KCZ63996.1 hypothetical protein L53_05720 [Hyphomonas sp. L-53-1-40]MDF1805829.1 hypothetical protein [Hyphomonas sp.]
MSRLFDAYIMVDWSAASKPVTGKNSIWIGILAKDARLKLQYQSVNIDTRLKARTFLDGIIAKLTGRGDRVLIGFDFSLGYPAGTAAALGLDTSTKAPWQAMHAHLASKMKDKADNSNPRYAIAAGMNYAITKGPFPFWGAPARDVVSTLSDKKPEFSGQILSEYRIVETHLRDSKRGQPKSVWQLAYTGSVGSQSLTGIPHVHALRQSLPSSRIWPFEFEDGEMTEETLEGIQVVIAEVYPSLIPSKPEKGETPDAAQVRQIAHYYSEMDEKGRLNGRISTNSSLDEGKISQIQSEEGWILGA